MYTDIANRFKIDLTEAIVVGDSLRDLQAAMEVNAIPILVKTGKGERTIANHSEDIKGIPVFNNLADFVDDYLKDKAVN